MTLDDYVFAAHFLGGGIEGLLDMESTDARTIIDTAFKVYKAMTPV